MLKLVWLIPVLPLFGFLLNFLLGRKLRLSERTVSLIACGVILASMLLSATRRLSLRPRRGDL